MRNFMNMVLFLVTIALFSGCFGTKQISPLVESKKKFANEDIFILSALYLEEIEDFRGAATLFDMLYKESDKKEYLYRSLKNSMAADDTKQVIQKVDEIAHTDDFELTRVKIMALVKEDEFLEAKKIAKKLVERTKDTNDYLLVSEIYVKLKEFDTALKYLEGAYIREYDEFILEKMAIILYVNLDRKKDAIAQLETHSRIHGCSQVVCTKLIGFYSNDNNIDGLLSTYLRLYETDLSKDTAQKIVQIYGYKRDFTKMGEFLEESGVDDELLLQLYIQMKNYKKAIVLSQKLYEATGDLIFLGQSAIFEYENSDNKRDPLMHRSVIKKLKEVIAGKRDGMYLNYLGYLLIDHDIDVAQGMSYVKDALKIEPNSPYFLDSLAWGYYKLRECDRADEIMKKVIKLEGGSNEEVAEHLEKIKECLKNKKGKN